MHSFSHPFRISDISKFDQTPGGAFSALAAQQASGAIPAEIPLGGFGDLALKDGNYDNKHYLRVSWRQGPWGVAVTGLKKGSFYQNSLTLPDGTRYVIPSMTTMDFSLDYRFDVMNVNQRIRFSVKNRLVVRAVTTIFGRFTDGGPMASTTHQFHSQIQLLPLGEISESLILNSRFYIFHYHICCTTLFQPFLHAISFFFARFARVFLFSKS